MPQPKPLGDNFGGFHIVIIRRFGKRDGISRQFPGAFLAPEPFQHDRRIDPARQEQRKRHITAHVFKHHLFHQAVEGLSRFFIIDRRYPQIERGPIAAAV